MLLTIDVPDTTRIASWKYALIGRGLGFIVFVVVVAQFFKHGLWKSSYVGIGTSVTKLKGIGSQHPVWSDSVITYDVEDLVFPSVERDGFFIGTHVIQTKGQHRGTCPGLSKTELCPCVAGNFTSNGINTGKCSSNSKYCDILAWCPVEEDSFDKRNLVSNVGNFTVFVKNYINFAEIPEVRSSIDGDHQLIPGKSLFTVNDIIDEAGVRFEDIQEHGCAIAVRVKWDCEYKKPCTPSLHFDRLDNPDNSLTKGYNFRKVNYYRNATGVLRRDLWKMYGVTVVFISSGTCAHFSLLAIIAWLAVLMGNIYLATIVSEALVWYLVPAEVRARANDEMVLEQSMSHIK